MYQVIVKGNTLKELKKAVQDVFEELNGGVLEKGPKVKISKDMSVEVEEVFDDIAPTNVIEMSDPRAEAPVAVSAPVDMSELDAEGVPWNAAIHSSGKTKYTKDQTWTIKRGVTDEEAEKYKAQFRGVTQQPVNVAPVVQPVVVQAPVVQAAPVAPPLPTMNSGHTLETFKSNFPLILGGLITEGKVTPDYINSLKAYFKVDQIWMVTEEQKTEMFNSFVQYKIINQVG